MGFYLSFMCIWFDLDIIRSNIQQTCLLNKSLICLHSVEYLVKLCIFYGNTYSVTGNTFDSVFIMLHTDIIYVENLV